MFERFTDGSRRVLALAQDEARLLGHNFIGSEHLLLGLVRDEDGLAGQALRSVGILYDAARDAVEEALGPGRDAVTTGSAPLTPPAAKVVELSLREAVQLGDDFIGSEHLLLALVREGGGAAGVLARLGGEPVTVRQWVLEAVADRPPDERSGALRPQPRSRPRPRARAVRGAEKAGPRCPACRADLEGSVAYRVLPVAPADPRCGAEPLELMFVYPRSFVATRPREEEGPVGLVGWWSWAGRGGKGRRVGAGRPGELAPC